MRLPHAPHAPSGTSLRRLDALPLVVQLDAVKPPADPDALRANRRLLGGKALNLARAAALGLPVPGGFVITTAAFRAGVDAMLDGAPALSDAESWLRAAAMPDAILDAIVDGYQRLGDDVAVAVRSSGTDEDGLEQSFAGQQVTLLNVRGADALVDAVRQVWCSLFGVESLLYRGRSRLDAAPPEMAVLVQRLVDAEVAGVLFTENPIEARRDEAMVCASWGLGETVVDGHAADTFYIHRGTGRVRAEVVDKPSRLRPAQRGGLNQDAVPAAQRSTACLSERRLRQLVALGTHLETIFGEPQDVEFAFVAGQKSDDLVLLQSRPITARPGMRSSTGHAAAAYSNANVGEALPGVGTPMTWSIIHNFARRGFETAFGALGLDVPEDYALVASFRGRVYLNISEFVSVASQIPLLTAGTLARLGGVPEPDSLGGTYARLSPVTFLRRLPVTIPRLAVSQLSSPVAARWWSRTFQQQRDAFFRRGLTLLSRSELRAVLAEIDALFNRTGEVMLASASNFLMSYVVVTEALKRLGGREAQTHEAELFSGLTNVKSAAPGLELLELARWVKEGPGLLQIFESSDNAPEILDRLRRHPAGQGFLGRLDAFLARWGHRAPREAEIATPRWREDPSFLISVVRRHLAAPYLPTPEAIEAERSAHRTAVTQLIRRHFLTGVGLAFRGLLRWAQHHARQREELRSYVVDTLSMYRTFFLEVGRRLAVSGVLTERDDVFFLTYDEVRRWLELDATVEHVARRNVAYRRAAYNVYVNSPDPPDTFTLVHDRVVSEDPPLPRHSDVLDGLPGAPGRVTGRARVILALGADDVPIRPGEILVTPFTDVGWTPLFLVAAGVVTDRGGPLSHSCVVAREYGIPAVVGVQGATRAIRTGDMLTVDGQQGRVHIARS